MYFMALASDYDGTIAEHGAVDEPTIAALKKCKDSGRKLILVTGRELPDLKRVFPHVDLFDRIVAENGALLYNPKTEEERAIAPAPPAEFIERLKERGVADISVGRSIVATWEPHQVTALEVINEMGLELEIIFNKGAVMILPSGINKAAGLKVALEELALSPLNVVGVGDAENDHALLRMCGCGAAVANALDALKDTADVVLKGDRGRGVAELVDAMLEQDYRLAPSLRHALPLGKDGEETVSAFPDDVVLIAGSSGIGKSTLATALTERMAEQGWQFCIFDPEGDYEGLEGAVTVGDTSTPPVMDHVLELLDNPLTNVVVDTLAFELRERPGFFAELMPQLATLRSKAGRPHWLIIDEAHHLMPESRNSASLALTDDFSGVVLITVHPDAVSQDVLRTVTMVVALGPKAGEVINSFCACISEKAPALPAAADDHQVLFWNRADDTGVRALTVEKPRQAHKRHTRKYVEGRLDETRSFYFRGPKGELNLRAQNLMVFLQMAEGVDERTWEHHRRTGDYSKWFRDRIGDRDLADETARIEADRALSADESRRRVAKAVRRRYTAPASEKD
ncbi:HAD-IIB family hydrolase [Rhizobium sp. BR 362]|uniref:HAD-IIB family hydrolase n=1 Tax=Rhizobium sp. BR 362 TaxID=3040670 RepID=UPI002F41935E